MKNYIKGVITGIIISAAVCSIPALADTIDALFNNVRISVNGVDQIQWGENIELSDGAETPASILYNGTTYLPMRKLGELSGSKIYWNGDSRTVGMTGAQKDIKVIAEKPDKNGNVWTYYTFKAEEYNSRKNTNVEYDYLGVKDETRGFERVYKTEGNPAVTDEAIYFIKITEKPGDGNIPPHANFGGGKYDNGELTKINFANDADTQDGECIYDHTFAAMYGGGVIDDVYAYTVETEASMHAHTIMRIYNYQTGKVSSCNPWSEIRVLEVRNNDDNIVFVYEKVDSVSKYEIVFDKNTVSFGKETTVDNGK